jgi:hypothetical protein
VRIERIERKKGELNLPLIYFLILCICGVGAYALYLLNKIPLYPCVFKTITGYPCPTCGSTRVVLNIFKPDFGAAFMANPLIFLAGAGFLIWGLYGFYVLISKKKIKIKLTQKESSLLKWSVLIAVLLNWMYLIVVGI